MPLNTAPLQSKAISQPADRRPRTASRPRRLLSWFGHALLPVLLAVTLLIVPGADSVDAAKRAGKGSQIRTVAVHSAPQAAARKAKRAKQVKRAKRVKQTKRAQMAKKAKRSKQAKQAKKAKQAKQAKKAKKAKKANRTQRVKQKRQAQRANARPLRVAQAAPGADLGTPLLDTEAAATNKVLAEPASPADTEPLTDSDPAPVLETVGSPAPPIEESLTGEPQVMDIAPDGPEADGLMTGEPPSEPVVQNESTPSENRSGAPARSDQESTPAPETPAVVAPEAPDGDLAMLPDETAPEPTEENVGPIEDAPVANPPALVTELPALESNEPVEPVEPLAPAEPVGIETEAPVTSESTEPDAPVVSEAVEPVETSPDPTLSEAPEDTLVDPVAKEVVAEEASPAEEAAPVTEETVQVGEAAPVAEEPIEAPVPAESAASTPELVVEAISENDQVMPGQVRTYRFRITNPATSEVRARISATNSLPGWTSEIRDASGGATLPNIVTLGGGEAIDVVVIVAIPDDAANGQTNQTQLSVNSVQTEAPSA